MYFIIFVYCFVYLLVSCVHGTSVILKRYNYSVKSWSQTIRITFFTQKTKSKLFHKQIEEFNKQELITKRCSDVKSKKSTFCEIKYIKFKLILRDIHSIVLFNTEGWHWKSIQTQNFTPTRQNNVCRVR